MKDNGLSMGRWVVLALALTLFGLWNWHLSLVSGQLEDIKHAIIAEGVCSDGYMPFNHFQNMGLVVRNNTDSDIEITQWSPGDNVGLTLFLAAGERQIVSPVVTGVDPNNPNCASLEVGFKANRRLMVNGMWLDEGAYLVQDIRLVPILLDAGDDEQRQGSPTIDAGDDEQRQGSPTPQP